MKKESEVAALRLMLAEAERAGPARGDGTEHTAVSKSLEAVIQVLEVERATRDAQLLIDSISTQFKIALGADECTVFFFNHGTMCVYQVWRAPPAPHLALLVTPDDLAATAGN